MIMSRKIERLLVLVIIALFNTENSLGKLVFEGSTGIINGFPTLTNTKKHVYGQAFNDEPFPFKNSTNGNMTSFSLTFFFAIVPEHRDRGAHGMAFMISPTRGDPGAFADQYLGIFNDTNNGKSSNHAIAVELDIHKDDEFDDIDDNHVGININGTKKHTYDQAFDDSPLPFKNSTNGTVISFSINFFFAIIPEYKHNGSHGMAFVISPTRGIPSAFADQYLGIFNDTNNGKSSNHVIAVELDIHKDDEFGDVDDNHVGININGMRSSRSAPAGYYDQKGEFKNLSLASGKLLRVTILYSREEKQLNVTLSPAEEAVPKRPLLSLNQDLSPFLLEEMYIGFSASTGAVGAIHYMLLWYVFPFLYVPALDFPIPIFPPYPKAESQVKRIVLVTCLTFALFVAFAASIISLFFYRRQKKVKEFLEEWEIQCGPHRFSYKELFKATKGFKNKQLLGKGGFGQVFKGTLLGSDTEIAVKRISHDSTQGMQEFLAEISTIGRLRHPNLVRLQGYCRYKEELYLVYDFMPNGSLDKYLYRRANQEQLTWDQRFKIIKDVASALCYLHHEWVQVVIHRDIKPANVLIDHQMNASLGDFGLAKLYDQGYDPQTSRVAGTFGYIAPELIRSGRPSTGTDVYAFGMFMLEVSCGRRLIEPRAATNEVVLAEWTLDCWEKGDILEAINERLRQEHNKEQRELVLKLGVLCSHEAAGIRPDMSKVVEILEGNLQLPENLLDIVKAEKVRMWSKTSERVLDVLTSQASIGTLTLTEPFTSRGR